MVSEAGYVQLGGIRSGRVSNKVTTLVIDSIDDGADERRLGMFTIMYDSHLCLFYSSSPQASVAEMTGDMLCNEELFEAGTAIEFERIMMLEPPGECLSMCELINGLTRGARVGVQHGFPTLHPLQLQAVIWGESPGHFGDEH